MGSLACSTLLASVPNLLHYWTRILQQSGFSTDSPEDIARAAKSNSYFERYIALQLLTHRIGKDAIPQLKESLADEHIKVRWVAAHLLGTLGDKSGLERMRQDFAELVPRGGAAEPVDPNVAKDPSALRKWQRNRQYRIQRALEVAKVLAELDDRCGYELAAKIVRESPGEEQRLASDGQDQPAGSMAALRSLAVGALAEIAKTDQNTLAEEGREPVALLSGLAASEKRKTIFKQMLKAAEGLRGDIGIKILDRAKDNPHQAQLEIRRATRSLGNIRAEKALQNK
jgi:hypothetical protein